MVAEAGHQPARVAAHVFGVFFKHSFAEFYQECFTLSQTRPLPHTLVVWGAMASSQVTPDRQISPSLGSGAGRTPAVLRVEEEPEVGVGEQAGSL